MKQIPLTQGKFALVDDSEYDYLMQWKWYAKKGRNTYYACRNDNSCSGQKTIRMHRQIMGVFDSQIKIDHSDGNGLNNQTSNLRQCTNSQNCMNSRVGKNNKLGIKGVCLHRATNKYQASIRANGNKVYLGLYKTEEQAAKAYNEAAVKYHGEFARLNELKTA